MSVVYKAEHGFTGELVAVKLLPGWVKSSVGVDEIRERFLKEPRMQLLARHPNVLRVIDAGVDGVQPFLVTVRYAAAAALTCAIVAVTLGRSAGNRPLGARRVWLASLSYAVFSVGLFTLVGVAAREALGAL